MKLPPAKQKKLFNEATAILRSLYWKDVKQLTMPVVHNETLQEQLNSKELGSEVKQDK
ncbi:hypothetical protein FD755_025436 [Muntiacus reevesi]|uniref:Uncharacterized protein n=1 Tax=Muntiacus reevesi TaxID=9886 RepID=A0A5N3UMF1_MUNRE|nr:hypothetical protein FD755_025436 [Muntiacus reevesi]